MASKKGVRIIVTLECTECRSNTDKRSPGVSRYTTTKNRRNTTGRMELKEVLYSLQHPHRTQRNQVISEKSTEFKLVKSYGILS